MSLFVMEILTRILCAALLTTLALNVNAARIWMEAESGAEYDPLLAGSDLSASDDTFLVSWKYADYRSRSNDDGRVVFEVYIPTSGTYKLWGRIRTDNSGDRPYDISVGNGDTSDNGQWQSWAPYWRSSHIGGNEIWQWHYSGFSKYFSKGTHKIRLIQRSGGYKTHLDKILLTNESGFTPSGSGGNESTPNISNPYKSYAVSTHGKLRISGNKLVNKHGHHVQLKGLSLHGMQWFPVAKEQTIPYLAQYFGIELVRLAMYVEGYDPTNPDIMWGGYMVNKSKLKARVRSAIQDAIKAGVYVLVDWHIHDAPNKYTSEAGAFFEEIARDFGHHPNIIYEIANEPVATSWSTIRNYAHSVIGRIRQHDPDNIILVGTPNWSQDVDTAARNKVNGSNIMYSFHYYAGTHDLTWAKNKVNSALNNGAAVMVSEWGSSDVGTSRSNFSRSKDWLSFINNKKLSWVSWSVGLKDENSSVLKPDATLYGPWGSGDLTPAGSFIKPYFNAPKAASSGSTSTPPPTSGSSSDSSGVPTAGTNNLKFVNKDTKECIQAGGTVNGSAVKMNPCDGGSDQSIDLGSVSGYIRMDFDGSDQSIDAGSRSSGSPVNTYIQSNHGNRRLKFIAVGSYFQIKSVTNGLCIDATSSAAVWRSCNAGDNSQLWSNSQSSTSSGTSTNTSSCLSYNATSLKELVFSSGSGGCINVAGGLDGKEVSIADSDNNASCNLRGTATGSNGGSLSVSSDWKTSTSLKGGTLKISVSNGCRYFKLRIR